MPGLLSHKGPILTVANWSGTWPGLVGMLNLNGSLTKAGKKYSTLWSEDFTDEPFRDNLKRWLQKGEVRHNTKHVTPLKKVKVPAAERQLGEALAAQLRREKAIMGIFDEGCMGMYNAIIPDELLNPAGVYKERLSQSALYYETTQVSDDEARAVKQWMVDRGMKFVTGPNPQNRPDRRADAHRSARCTSPPCGSPTISAATRSASSTSRGSRTCCRPATWSKARSTTPTARRSAAATAAECSTRASRCRTSTRWTSAPASTA